ncbi:MAG TPA: sensor histidine kinase N-terminal domain-containing protein, partial [Rhodanobacteraceae bacterium]|nr:sensor histidine kinase N-terminal domain-containing protein [Rhodanobacteraceae bacterium]
MKATSLRWRLRWLVVMALAAVLLPLGVLSFRATLHEIQELSDGRLAQSARTLLTLIERIGPEALGTAAATATGMPHVPITIPLGTRTYETEVAFQVTGPDGRVRLATANFAALAPPLASQRGFHEIRIGRYRWRTYTLSDPASGIVIRTGERYDSRRDILRALLLDHSLPLLFGLPLIALLVGWAVRRGLRPLDQLAQSLRARAPGSREPI